MSRRDQLNRNLVFGVATGLTPDPVTILDDNKRLALRRRIRSYIESKGCKLQLQGTGPLTGEEYWYLFFPQPAPTETYTEGTLSEVLHTFLTWEDKQGLTTPPE